MTAQVNVAKVAEALRARVHGAGVDAGGQPWPAFLDGDGPDGDRPDVYFVVSFDASKAAMPDWSARSSARLHVRFDVVAVARKAAVSLVAAHKASEAIWNGAGPLVVPDHVVLDVVFDGHVPHQRGQIGSHTAGVMASVLVTAA